MQIELLKMVAATTVLAATMWMTGCRHTASAVKNSDGTITNSDGSVTIPQSQAQLLPLGTVESQKAKQNPDGSVTFPANSPEAQRERQQLAPNGPPPAPGAELVVASNQPASNQTPQAAPDASAQPPAAAPVTAPAGTAVTIRLNTTLDTSRIAAGDRFSGVLERSVTSHGEVVFARGTPVSGEVVQTKGKGRLAGAGDIELRLTEIGPYHVSTSVYEKTDKGEGKRTGAFIGGGAGLGTILGAVAGGGKGAVIGGLAGAGAGTAGATTGRRDVVIPAETVITFRLKSAVTRS